MVHVLYDIFFIRMTENYFLRQLLNFKNFLQKTV